MYRAGTVAAIALLIAIPVGGVGAWAFNPDSGALLHSELLWRIFGIMCEGGMLALAVLVLGVILAALTRKLLSLVPPAPGR